MIYRKCCEGRGKSLHTCGKESARVIEQRRTGEVGGLPLSRDLVSKTGLRVIGTGELLGYMLVIGGGLNILKVQVALVNSMKFGNAYS
jgi:hypothetical protein